MIFTNLKKNIITTDLEFDVIFPFELKETSNIHFTPVDVSILAARYLATNEDSKILDIGSGAGKFCLIGSACSEGTFTGVEQRKKFCVIADGIVIKYNLANVTFIHSNITDVVFSDFTGFYFFNAFDENKHIADRIDDEAFLGRDLYETYSNYVKKQLHTMPKGTKLVTYFSYSTEVPDSYTLMESSFEGKLKYWEKLE
ncbi:MAG: class I SAM-dependent methyltransferase [Saprospiraceae bacterium]|nr:class I SAM-dependent methyltransferase [Saprospiraceae bacterium]